MPHFPKPMTEARLLHEARKRLTKGAAFRLAPKYSLYALRHTWMNRLLTSAVDALDNTQTVSQHQ